MRKQSIIWGIILIIVGCLFLINNLGILNINIFFKGWWTLFLIIPSIIGLFKKETIYTSLITLSLGILLLLASQNIIKWGMIWKLFIPILIIIIGLILIFKKNSNKVSLKNAKEYVSIFGDVDEVVKEIVSDFEVSSIFGEVNLDLSKATINKDINIECTCIFGSINLRLPDNINLNAHGIPIFGGVENKYHETKTNNEYTLNIEYTCLFGGIDLK